MSFYQKYRPRSFDTLVGQTYIRRALQNALRLDRTVGAYLFHGSHGTGKTTVARIFAKALNCLHLRSDGNPCLECSICLDFEQWKLLDVIEIDAASNTGVDNIRDLIERAQFQPTETKYKVYIIDEAHMLSRWAFNALLKTLEEPPMHVKFILATTEIYKVPDTIVSRTQRYDFRRIGEADIIEHLRFIARSESIEAEDLALSLIARLSKWGFRDAIVLFEQYSIDGKLLFSTIRDNLEIVEDDFLSNFVQALLDRQYHHIKEHLHLLLQKSTNIKLFFEQLLPFLVLRMKQGVNSPDIQALLRIYDVFEQAHGRLKFLPDPWLALDTACVRLMHDAVDTHVTHVITRPHSDNQTTSSPVLKDAMPLKKQNTASDTPLQVPSPWESASDTSQSFDWARFVEIVKNTPKRWFVAMSLKVCRFEIHDSQLTIFANSEFNRSKIDTPEIRQFLIETLETLFGRNFDLAISLDSNSSFAPPLGTNDLITTAGSIF